MLFEVHQPVGQLQIVDVEQLAAALERRRIFAVRVDHHDVTLRGKLRDSVQDQSDRSRLAGAGRAEHREMLGQHRIDVERAADVFGRIDGPDFDVGLVAGGEHRPQVGGGDRQNVATGDRVASDAAAEVAHPSGRVAGAFAEEVDLGDDLAARVGPQGADVGDQPAASDLHLDLASDLARRRDRGIAVALEGMHAGGMKADLRAGAGDLEHLADRFEGRCGCRRGGRAAHVVGAEAAHFIEELAQVRLVIHVLVVLKPSGFETGGSQKPLRLA